MRNWLITGVSSGFGLELAKLVLASGDRVVGTLRRADQVAAFEALAPDRAKAVLIDVTNRAAVPGAVAEAAAWLGGIDVLVNNAGAGRVGVFEELNEAEFDASIDLNFFAAVSVIRAALPAMRERGRGDIINFSSVAGFSNLPALSAYGSAKAALDSFSESLAAEMAPFGVRVMVVSPGPYNTGFGTNNNHAANPMAVYNGTPGGKMRDALKERKVLPTNDPKKLAAAVIKLLDEPELPVRFVGSANAVASLDRKLTQQRETLEKWADLSRAAG